MKKAIIAFASLVILAACHANFDKAKSGLVYKIFPGKGGAKLATAKFVKLDIEYTVKRKGKDSVLNSTFGKAPQYNPIDTGAQFAYSYMEILPKCSVGDSVEFTLSVDTLRKRNVQLPPEIFPKGDFIKGRLKILAAFNTRDEIMADITREKAKEGQKEIKSIEDYIAKKHLNAQKTRNGAYVVIEQPGAGPKADSGMVAMVLYKGYFLTGKAFETNMDTTGAGKSQPYPVRVGTHSVIQGWDDALPYFSKGGKGIVIVPSELGYGPQGNGPIPGGTTLIFDIEIADVKTPAEMSSQQPTQK